MTPEAVAKRPEFQQLRRTAEAFSASLRLITRAYAVDLNIIDPRVTCNVLTEHVSDEIQRRAVLAKLNSQERIAVGILNLRKLKT